MDQKLGQPLPKNPQKMAFLWILMFTAVLAWRLPNLDAFGLSNDEGAHLMWAKLAVDGYTLYQETLAVQSPLFLESVAWTFRLLGPSIAAGRITTLIGFVALAIILSILAYRAGGWLAACGAVLLLGASPLMFSLSRLVMAEVPATAWAVLAVGLACLAYESERWQQGWFLAAGLALGLSFITKALHPFAVVPIGWLLLIRAYQSESGAFWRNFIINSMLVGIGTMVPMAAVFVIYEPGAVYDQLVAFRGDLRAAIPGSWNETATHFTTFFESHWGYWLLASSGLLSLISAPRESRLYPMTWSLWLGAGVVMLLWHAPLFRHHFVVLLPPLILLGAFGLAQATDFWQKVIRRDTISPSRWMGGLIITLMLTGALFNVPDWVQANQQTAAIVTGGREAQALDLLRQVSHPTDFVMGDSQLLIFMAQRRTPPPLGDVALVAIKAGRQTAPRMQRLTLEYQAPAVVQWSLRLPWLPDYLDWVEMHYLARRVWDNDHIIYFAPRVSSEAKLPNPLETPLGDRLTLRGFSIENESLSAGDTLHLKVYWQVTAPLDANYTVFTQLLAEDGTLAAGWDSQPLGGHFPTGAWPAGEIVTDMVQVPLSELPPGTYTLITGMYTLDTLARLQTDAGTDFIVLTTVSLN